MHPKKGHSSCFTKFIENIKANLNARQVVKKQGTLIYISLFTLSKPKEKTTSGKSINLRGCFELILEVIGRGSCELGQKCKHFNLADTITAFQYIFRWITKRLKDSILISKNECL